MNTDITQRFASGLVVSNTTEIPILFIQQGEKAVHRFIEFFTANINNDNTRQAYYRAVKQFSDWCEYHDVDLLHLKPAIVALYFKQLEQELAAPSVKQHLAAVRMLFDYLVTGQIIEMNPATAVRGPKYVIKQGKTPVLTAGETRELLDAIDTSKLSGLRDRALIGAMVFSFARIGAVLNMNVEDYFPKGKRWWFRLHEKGGKYHEVPANHKAEEYLDAYIKAAAISNEKKHPLFPSFNRKRQLTDRRLDKREAWAMIKRRAANAGLPDNVTCHTFRATGITTFLENGGTVETAQHIAAHESPRTTKLYDRRSDTIALEEVERIRI